MYGSKYGVLWALLVVVLFVVIPMSVVTISSLGVLVLFVIVSTAAPVRLASDGASAPPTESVNLPDTVARNVGSASGLGLARKDLGY